MENKQVREWLPEESSHSSTSAQTLVANFHIKLHFILEDSAVTSMRLASRAYHVIYDMFFGVVHLVLLGLWGFCGGDRAAEPTGLDSVSCAHRWLCAKQSVSNGQTSVSLSGFILAENTVSLLRPASHSFTVYHYLRIGA